MIKILHFPGRDKPWTFKKYSSAILFSSVKVRFFFQYFNDQKEMINSVRIHDPNLAVDLQKLHGSLIQKRSVGYQLRRISVKLTRPRRNTP